MGDPELTAVRRPFEAAFDRMCQADDLDLLHDELSNMLHHMYRLGELCAGRWGLKNDPARFNAKVKVPGALGALWVRRYDTQEIVSVSDPADVYTDRYLKLYELLVWKPVAAIEGKAPGGSALARYQDYQGHLENNPVLDTMRPAFDGLATLV
jgi:hypothetical protein